MQERVKKLPGARDFLREQRCNLLALRSYFDASLVSRENVEWLLVLTLPNSGSTALAQLLLTAPNTVALTERAEGQWLVPSLCRRVARWDEGHLVWPRKIRAAWLDAIGMDDTAPVLVIEKSPPNLCRYRSIVAALRPMPSYIATFSRDPYATCASWHQRYGLEGILRDWCPSAGASVRSEKDYFRLLGSIWLERAQMLLAARENSIADLRYEDFTDDVNEIARKLGTAIPQLRNISPNARVKVKDYDEQEVTNMNEEQIGALTPEQVAAISCVLATDATVVEQLGYSIR